MRDHSIAIPGLRVEIPGRLMPLIDSEPIQRLKYVMQLPLAIRTFEGARHSRFGHTLEVLHNALEFVEALGKQVKQTSHRMEFTEEDRVTLGAAAIVHDVGHVLPFAHVIEEEESIGLHHEALGREILRKDLVRAVASCEVSSRDVENLAFPETEDQGTHAGKTGVLRSILSGDVDADRMAYLRLDSLMCGVTYGLGIDRAKIIENLTVTKEGSRIAVLPYAEVAVQDFVWTRYCMIKDVYWGARRYRAGQAMLRRALREALAADGANPRELIGRSEESALDWIAEHGAPAAELARALRDRSLHHYFRLATVEARQPLYRKILGNPLKHEEVLRGKLDLPVNHVLIDMPYKKKDILKGFRVTHWENRKVVDEWPIGGEALMGLKDDFHLKAKPIHVFAEPGRAKEIQRSMSEKEILAILEAV